MMWNEMQLFNDLDTLSSPVKQYILLENEEAVLLWKW